MDRKATIERKTNETDITVSVNLDGQGLACVATGIGFFDHMLNLLAKHSLININVRCDGDLQIDGHHSVEDIGIALGKAIAEAVGDKRGIFRYGNFIAPMDEACVMTAIDISGRGGLFMDLPVSAPMVGDFDTELVEEFFVALCNNAGINAHIKLIAGTNGHHIIECAFKSFAKSLRAAVSKDPRNDDIPSTKGRLV